MRISSRPLWSLVFVTLITHSSVRLYGQVVGVPKPPQAPAAANGAKFPPRSGGHDFPKDKGCWTSCTKGPVRFTPSFLEGCEGEDVVTNFRIDAMPPNTLSNRGDRMENEGGAIDWGDGETTDLAPKPGLCCEWNEHHTYAQSMTYIASARYGQQFTNAFNPAGGCSYRCEDAQQMEVRIFPKNSPVCSTGRLVSNKQPRKP
jgi:hypothetical protein